MYFQRGYVLDGSFKSNVVHRRDTQGDVGIVSPSNSLSNCILITIAVIRTCAMSGRDLDWEEDACAKGSLMLLQATCTKRSVSWPFFVPYRLGVASLTIFDQLLMFFKSALRRLYKKVTYSNIPASAQLNSAVGHLAETISRFPF